MGRESEDVMERCRREGQAHDRRKQGDGRGYTDGRTSHRIRFVLLAGARRDAVACGIHVVGHGGHLHRHRAGLNGRQAHSRHREDGEQQGEEMFGRSGHNHPMMGPERLRRKQVPAAATFGPDRQRTCGSRHARARGTARRAEAHHEQAYEAFRSLLAAICCLLPAHSATTAIRVSPKPQARRC